MYHFYESPQRDTRIQSTGAALNSSTENGTTAVHPSTAHVQEETPEDIEIYINNKNRITNTPKEVENPNPSYSKDYLIKKGFNF